MLSDVVRELAGQHDCLDESSYTITFAGVNCDPSVYTNDAYNITCQLANAPPAGCHIVEITSSLGSVPLET